MEISGTCPAIHTGVTGITAVSLQLGGNPTNLASPIDRLAIIRAVSVHHCGSFQTSPAHPQIKPSPHCESAICMPSISQCFHADDSRVIANTEARYVVVLRKLFKQYAATVREIDSRGSSCRQAAPRFIYCRPITNSAAVCLST